MRYPLNKLDDYFLKYNKITDETSYEVFDIDAKKLISAKRIDLAVKYFYIKCRDQEDNLDFAMQLYKSHIEAFSDGTFKESGNASKSSIERYIEVFDNMIDAFSNGSFHKDSLIVPIGGDNELLDGAHRTACAAYFNRKIKVVRFHNLHVDYGYTFFKRRLMDKLYLDFALNAFTSILENNHFPCIPKEHLSHDKVSRDYPRLLGRKVRYAYRRSLNYIKSLLGKPV